MWERGSEKPVAYKIIVCSREQSQPMPSVVSQPLFSLPDCFIYLEANLNLLCGFFFPSQGLTKLFFPEIILQVDVLKATALPLLKQFGIDGESFELKVRMSRLLVAQISVKYFLTNSLEELYGSVCVWHIWSYHCKKTHRILEPSIADFALKGFL